jgi:hypothetical protein
LRRIKAHGGHTARKHERRASLAGSWSQCDPERFGNYQQALGWLWAALKHQRPKHFLSVENPGLGCALGQPLKALSKPQVFLKNFGESGIEYEIRFWLEDYNLHYPVCDAIRTNMWYGLRRHGIRIQYPTQTVQLERPARDKHLEVQTAARIILRQQPLFRCLSDEQLDALLPRGGWSISDGRRN